MARKYRRDNKGRFAGGGGGATARGGRLKTAAGNKRKTQTMQSAAAPKGTIGKPKGLKPGAIKAKPVTKKPLARSGQKLAVQRLQTNAEMGRKGVVSMSARSKSVRSGDVAFRRSERLSQIKERQSGITARRQINRASTYKPDGSFDQSAVNLNQRKLSRSKALQQRLGFAATGASMASAALSQRRGTASRAKPARAAAKPARKVETSAAAISRRRARANAPRTSTYLSQRLNTNSVITRSAANAIYNRQGKVARLAGGRVDPSVARSGIGVMQGLSGSKRQRADQLREQARKRVVGGRRR